MERGQEALGGLLSPADQRLSDPGSPVTTLPLSQLLHMPFPAHPEDCLTLGTALDMLPSSVLSGDGLNWHAKVTPQFLGQQSHMALKMTK